MYMDQETFAALMDRIQLGPGTRQEIALHAQLDMERESRAAAEADLAGTREACGTLRERLGAADQRNHDQGMAIRRLNDQVTAAEAELVSKQRAYEAVAAECETHIQKIAELNATVSTQRDVAKAGDEIIEELRSVSGCPEDKPLVKHVQALRAQLAEREAEIERLRREHGVDATGEGPGRARGSISDAQLT